MKLTAEKWKSIPKVDLIEALASIPDHVWDIKDKLLMLLSWDFSWNCISEKKAKMFFWDKIEKYKHLLKWDEWIKELFKTSSITSIQNLISFSRSPEELSELCNDTVFMNYFVSGPLIWSLWILFRDNSSAKKISDSIFRRGSQKIK